MKKELEYMKAGFFITMKKISEYKANTYSALLAQIFYYITQILILYIISDNFGDVIGWNFYDFIFFFLLFDLVETIAGFFIWGIDSFRKVIQRGELNAYLNKPINRFIAYNFRIFSAGGTPMLFIGLLAFIFAIIFLDIKLYNIFFGIIIATLIIIFQIFNRKFAESINFWNFGIAMIFRRLIFEGQMLSVNYPADFFKSKIIRTAFSIVPLFFISSLLLPTLRNKEVWSLELQLILLISLNLFFIIITFVNWHYGLKKYEAYG